MERAMTEDRSTDWETFLDFSPADSWESEGPHWAADLPDLALPLESLGFCEAAALPIAPDENKRVRKPFSTKMKLGIAASIFVHTALLGAALASLYWITPLEAGDVESVAVDIIETQSVSSNSASATQSDAVESMVSSGAQAVEPVEAETIEEVTPVETAVVETVEPVEAETVTQPLDQPKPQTAEPLAESTPPETPPPVEPIETAEATPVEAASVAAEVPVLATAMLSPVPPLETVAPVEPVEAVEPIDPIETSAAPVPMTRTVKQVSEPTYPKATPNKPEVKKPVTKAAEQPARKPVKDVAAPTKRVATAGGNGGKNDADAQASAQSSASRGSSGGGSGTADKYPGRVQAKLQRALRYPSAARGATGEVQVQFVVAANGSVSGVRIVGSSGNPILDDAAINTVNRAAPFPEIPADAGRSSWTFTLPLGIVR